MRHCLVLLLVILRLPVLAQDIFVTEKSPLVISCSHKLSPIREDSLVLPDYRLSIMRDFNQTVLLLLPAVGTWTYAILYKSKDYEINKNYQDKLEYLREKTDAKSLPDGQPLTLNLTTLKDGEYTVIYHTDLNYPLIKVSLVTRKRGK